MGLSARTFTYKPSTCDPPVQEFVNERVLLTHQFVRFTPINGQDRKQPLPYNQGDKLDVQIKSSFQKSLQNLRTVYIDSLLLHSPMESLPRTITAWKALVSLQDSGKVKHIGVSNTYDVSVLEALEQKTGRRVQIVQNRWYEGNQWDNQVWKYCQTNGIQYQYVTTTFVCFMRSSSLVSCVIRPAIGYGPLI